MSKDLISLLDDKAANTESLLDACTHMYVYTPTILLTLNSDIGAPIPRSTLGKKVSDVYLGAGALTVQPGTTVTFVYYLTAAC